MNKSILTEWIADNRLEYDSTQIEQLIHYSMLLHQENKKYNLTGLKDPSDILQQLIINSIHPLRNIDVPRGTRMLDIGTGSGIPGMPLSIAFPHISSVLVDSNRKKITFIQMAADTLQIKNVLPVAGRSEELLDDDKWKGSFDLVVSRAVGNVYMLAELASQYVSIGGYLYLYSSHAISDIEPEVLSHIDDLGLVPFGTDDFTVLAVSPDSIVFKKVKQTPDKYPRRFSVIKREAAKYK